ncbi:RTA1 like protein [Amniculicola lignicola CBS 123094]|uniref:RTA1 like protein n=1 Tax=Amniculicola lignicola CBS 123094 TaxID=1392246 RepID=A0A6A5VYP2_9PLEO|nr:RTA1 like protein [Amniculicola lignicola CBS 123094]
MPNGPPEDGEPWHPYLYTPSVLAAALFTGLFGATTLVHIYQVYRKRAWWLIPLVLGGVCEVIGFIGRLLSEPNNFSVLGPFLIQAIFILIAPTLFAASIYMILGRIILLVDGERYSWVKQKHLTIAFVMGDFVTLNIQSNGGGLTASKTPSTARLGEIIIIVGLFSQLAFFLLFIFVAGVFQWRLVNDRPVKKHVSFRYLRRFQWLLFWQYFNGKKVHRFSSSSTSTGDHAPLNTVPSHRPIVNIDALPWRRHLAVLYITSVLILVRSVFRLVEFIQGKEGYLLSKEIFLYGMDAVLMLIVMLLFNWWHPSQITELIKEREGERSGEQVGLEEQGQTARAAK